MKQLLFGLALGVVANLSVALPAFAGGATTETTHSHKETETFVDILCEEGQLYQITTTYNEVEHVTTKDGMVRATFTQTGKFVAVPVDEDEEPIPGGEIIRGSFTVWGGFNATVDEDGEPVPGTPAQGTFTFSLRGVGDEGTRIQSSNVDHFNVVPDGTVHEFFHGHCNVR